MSIINLPKYILLSICNDWLEPCDVGLLDCGLCNSVERQTFLKLLESMKVSSLEDSYATRSYLLWLSACKVKVFDLSLKSNLKLFGTKHVAECLKFLHCLEINDIGKKTD